VALGFGVFHHVLAPKLEKTRKSRIELSRSEEAIILVGWRVRD